ncbi:MAG: HAD-IA family hydrolase [Succinivibrionaceae bacterium]|nr:HAD-IA family hydrolase [Succinivibrionaceae bacterium]
MSNHRPLTTGTSAVLFDLDGTLIDTWRDLMNASNHVLAKHGFAAMDPAKARLLATDGIAAMLGSVMGDRFDGFEFDLLKNEFLDYYLANIHVESKLFDGFEQVLDHLRSKLIPWGIVTNKPGFLAKPLLDSFDCLGDCMTLVCNETVREKKPHPAPVLHALKELKVRPENAVYVGDHSRDISCGNNAGTVTVAAGWGYIRENENLALWHATYCAQSPADLPGIFSQIRNTAKIVNVR